MNHIQLLSIITYYKDVVEPLYVVGTFIVVIFDELNIELEQLVGSFNPS